MDVPLPLVKTKLSKTKIALIVVGTLILVIVIIVSVLIGTNVINVSGSAPEPAGGAPAGAPSPKPVVGVPTPAAGAPKPVGSAPTPAGGAPAPAPATTPAPAPAGGAPAPAPAVVPGSTVVPAANPAPAPVQLTIIGGTNYKPTNFINRGCWAKTSNTTKLLDEFGRPTSDYPKYDHLGGKDVTPTQKYSSDLQYIEEKLSDINTGSYDTVGFYRDSQNAPRMRLAKYNSVADGVTYNYEKLGQANSPCGSYDNATKDAFLIYSVDLPGPKPAPPPGGWLGATPPPPSTGIIPWEPIAM